MSFSDALMKIGANAIRSALKGAQLHTDNPGTGGTANKSSAAPMAPSWSPTASDGAFDLSAPLQFVGADANGPIKYVSLWSSTDISHAVWYGNFKLSGDQTADSNGGYTLESLSVTGTSG